MRISDRSAISIFSSDTSVFRRQSWKANRRVACAHSRFHVTIDTTSKTSGPCTVSIRQGPYHLDLTVWPLYTSLRTRTKSPVYKLGSIAWVASLCARIAFLRRSPAASATVQCIVSMAVCNSVIRMGLAAQSCASSIGVTAPDFSKTNLAGREGLMPVKTSSGLRAIPSSRHTSRSNGAQSSAVATSGSTC